MKEYIVEAQATFLGRVRIWVDAESASHAKALVTIGRYDDIERIDDGSSSEPEIDCSELEVREVE